MTKIKGLRGWADNGFHDAVIPIEIGAKKPAVSGWLDWNATDENIAAWDKHKVGVGIRTKFFAALDVDIDNAEIVAKVEELAKELLGAAPRRVRKNSDKVLFVFRAKGHIAKIRRVYEDPFGNTGAVEILGDGQQFVAEGIHPSGAPYEWDHETIKADHLAPITKLDASVFFDELDRVLDEMSWSPVGGDKDNKVSGHVSSSQGAAPATTTELQILDTLTLGVKNDDAVGYDEWVRIGTALKASVGDTQEARDAFHVWSSKNAKYDEDYTDKTWDSLDPKGHVGAGTILWKARQDAFVPTPEQLENWGTRKSAQSDFAGAKIPELPTSSETKDKRTPREIEQARRGDPKTVGGDLLNYKTTPPEFLIESPSTGWLPKGTVAGLYGHGGTGKTLLALQLATCLALDIPPWANWKVKKSKVLFVTTEEDTNRMLRHQDKILSFYSRTRRDVGGNLSVHAWVDQMDNTLMTTDPNDWRGKKLVPSGTLEMLEDQIGRLGYEVVVLDVLSDLYPADENDRREVAQFGGMLKALAAKTGTTIVLLAHLAKTGVYSGSTAWRGLYRAMFNLSAPEELSVDHRELVLDKANMARAGDRYRLLWLDGVFALSGTGDPLADARAAVLRGIGDAIGMGVALKRGRQAGDAWGPGWIARRLAGEMSAEDLSRALDTLLDEGRVFEGPLGFKDAQRKEAQGLNVVLDETKKPN